MPEEVEQRRICWPNFDCTCLEGGCGYCNNYPFRNIDTIDRAISQGKGTALNRGNRTAGDLRTSFNWGKKRQWSNADSRIKEKR